MHKAPLPMILLHITNPPFLLQQLDRRRKHLSFLEIVQQVLEIPPWVPEGFPAIVFAGRAAIEDHSVEDGAAADDLSGGEREGAVEQLRLGGG